MAKVSSPESTTFKKTITTLSNIRNTYRHLIIDETSFNSGVRVELFTRLINIVNNKRSADPPLKLLLTGDPLQLPGVSKEIPVYDPKLKRTVSKGDIDSKAFFEAPSFKNFEITYLTEVKRQTDKDFIEALLMIREGRAEDAVDWFMDNVEFEPRLNNDFHGTTLLSTNASVNLYNQKYLEGLPGFSMPFMSKRSGIQRSEWKLIPDRLDLKRNTEVIVLSNNFDKGYANGDRATVLQTLLDSVLVRIERTGKEVLITPVTRENIPIGSSKSIGSIKYIPLKLGKYSSIHMSQGITLDSLQVRVTDSFLSRLSGGLYTALSRVRTKEGLRIVGTKDAFIKSCFVETKYLNFIKSIEQGELMAA